jgi:hypothetical protein
MSDVFLAYTVSDRSSAQELAGLLEESNLNVFDLAVDDTHWIKPISKALTDTQIVVVLWSSELADWSRDICLRAENNQKPLFIAYKADALNNVEPFVAKRQSVPYNALADKPFSLLVEAIEDAFLQLPTLDEVEAPSSSEPLWLDHSVDADWDLSSWLEMLPDPKTTVADDTPEVKADTSLLLTVRDLDISTVSTEQSNSGVLSLWIDAEFGSHKEEPTLSNFHGAYTWLHTWVSRGVDDPGNRTSIAKILSSNTEAAEPLYYALASAIGRVERDLFPSLRLRYPNFVHRSEWTLEVSVVFPSLGFRVKVDLPGNSQSDLQSLHDLSQALRAAVSKERKAIE